MPGIDTSVLSIWMVNYIILAALIVAAFLVGRDARRNRRSWLAAMAWAALTLFVFPIGLGLYFLFSIRSRPDLHGARS